MTGITFGRIGRGRHIGFKVFLRLFHRRQRVINGRFLIRDEAQALEHRQQQAKGKSHCSARLTGVIERPNGQAIFLSEFCQFATRANNDDTASSVAGGFEGIQRFLGVSGM